MATRTALAERLIQLHKEAPEAYRRFMAGLPPLLFDFTVMIEDRLPVSTILAFLEEKALTQNIKGEDVTKWAKVQRCVLQRQLRLALDDRTCSALLRYLGDGNAVQVRLEIISTEDGPEERPYFSWGPPAISEVEVDEEGIVGLLDQLFSDRTIDRTETPSGWATEEYIVVWKRRTN